MAKPARMKQARTSDSSRERPIKGASPSTKRTGPAKRGDPTTQWKVKTHVVSSPKISGNGCKSSSSSSDAGSHRGTSGGPVTPAKKPHTSSRVFTRHIIRRPWVVTDELKNIFESKFPAYEFVQALDQPPTHHGHALSALERAAVEDMMYREITKVYGSDISVVDIGGNARRHHNENRINIHSCCPELSPPDVLRNSRYEGLTNWCSTTVQECKVRADVYMAVHSLYYLSQQDVCSLVHESGKKILYASVHKFVDGYGALHWNGKTFESTYEMISESMVAQSVHGNDHGSYRHSNVLWLEENHYWDRKNKRGITWGYRKFGDTYLYTFRPCQQFHKTLRGKPLAMAEAVQHQDYVGKVDLGVEQYRPVVKLLNLTETTVKSYGPLFWTSSKQYQLFVPKHMVNQLSFFMVGKPRDKDSWHMCVREAKKMLKAEVVQIPSEWRVKLAIYLPALAFVAYLGTEIAAFNTLIKPKHLRMYERANQLFTLTPDPTPLISRICGKVASAFSCKTRVESEVDFAHEEMVHEYNSSRRSLEVLSARAQSATNFLTTTSTKALSRMREKAKVVKHDVCSKDDKVKLTQHLTAFSGYIPVVSTSNLTNEEIAIRNRVLCETPKPDQAEWDALMVEYRNDSGLELDPTRIDYDLEKMFHKWNENFPKGRKANQLKAWEELKTRNLEPKDMFRKFFVKVEKLMKSTPEGYEDFNPRAIQGATDHANVALSPFVAQVSKLVAHDWDGKKNEFFYTAGATGDRIGQWMADNYECGDWIVEIDFSTYDGTQGEQVQYLIDTMMGDFGIDEYGEARYVLNGHKHITGFSPNGLEYHVDYQMCSGNPNTSVSNSTTTGLTSRRVLRTEFGEVKAIAVMGDDNTTIIPQRCVIGKNKDECKERIKAHFLKFGFIAKVKIHESVAAAEFCSGVFWPCVVNGVETYVLGPKPGKMLPKVPYTLQSMKPEEVKGMVLGLETTCSYVPVCRVYVEEMLSKMSSVAEKRYVDKDAKYKVGYGGSSMTELGPSCMLADFFFERYDLDMHLVESSLRKKLRAGSLNDTVHWEFLNALVRVDC